MKKLKKLELKKQTIADLSDMEAKYLKGGTGTACVSATVASIAFVWELGQDGSWWTCAYNAPPPEPGQPSANDMWIGNVQHCLLDEVQVYALNTAAY
jgi:natural product precursor